MTPAQIKGLSDGQAVQIVNAMDTYHQDIIADNNSAHMTTDGIKSSMFPGYSKAAGKGPLNKLVNSIANIFPAPVSAEKLYNNMQTITTTGQPPTGFKYTQDFGSNNPFLNLQDANATAIFNRQTPVPSATPNPKTQLPSTEAQILSKVMGEISALINLGVPPSKTKGFTLNRDTWVNNSAFNKSLYTASTFNFYEDALHLAGDNSYTYDYDDFAGKDGYQQYDPKKVPFVEVNVNYG